MGDGVEEGVLALVAADFADQEDSVEDDAGGEQGEEEQMTPEWMRQDEAAFVENDPADVEDDGCAEREDAESDEKGDGSASSGDVHGVA